MADTPKRIGVLTSGGDAPGMNAAVRAVARTAINAGYEVIGFMRGYNGLVNSDYMVMNIRTVSDTIHRGGTLLYTARCEEFKTEQGVKKGASVCNDLNISGLVVIGGDGSFRGARDLTQYGIGCIGIPGTIDNDIGASQYSIGFDTAVNTVTEMVDKIRDTSQSHDRCTVVEVMGRRAGHIALHAGLATGATAVLVPEVKFDFERDIVKRIVNAAESGKKHFVIMVAEGVGGCGELAKAIQWRTGIESRASILGYVQRGGSPSARDRTMASRMGHHAVELLVNGQENRVVVYQNGTVTDFDMAQALEMHKPFDMDLDNICLEINS